MFSKIKSWDISFSFIAMIISLPAIWAAVGWVPLPESGMKYLLLAVSVISAVFLGCVFMGECIILSLSERALIKNMKKTRLYSLFMVYIHTCQLFFLLVIPAGFLSLFVENAVLHKVCIALFFTGLYFAFYLGRVLMNILIITRPGDYQGGKLEIE